MLYSLRSRARIFRTRSFAVEKEKVISLVEMAYSCIFENCSMPFEESLSIILAEMLAIRTRTRAPDVSLGLTARMTTLDIFEMMIRIDDLAVASSLSGINPMFERWALADPSSLVHRLEQEPKGYLLAVLLTVAPKGLAQMARHLSFFTWMEVARAANNLSQDQLEQLRDCRELEEYLAGSGQKRPDLSLPLIFPLPMPSVLRVVQSARFRLKLLGQEGYEEALQRYVRFFC